MIVEAFITMLGLPLLLAGVASIFVFSEITIAVIQGRPIKSLWVTRKAE